MLPQLFVCLCCYQLIPIVLTVCRRCTFKLIITLLAIGVCFYVNPVLYRKFVIVVVARAVVFTSYRRSFAFHVVRFLFISLF